MLYGETIYLRPFALLDADELLQFLIENKTFFEQYSMNRSNDYYSLEYQQNLIKKWEEDSQKDIEYKFGIFQKNNDELIGTIQLFQINRGSLQNAIIGYFLDKEQNGNGYATEATKLIVEFAFDILKLHRIEAGVMPHNIGSIRVLEKSGFHKEGIAKKNVKINDSWEDHQVLAIINPND
ncbi:GNAT family N-acetyltransferase [Lysinibacillus sp. ZYM-1]|uniref:GNAT family N-acetyltransferase n=1 Tax=Lysinibacillus sp. ZYM-1 TaxID=1681184 RepID=UPI0006CE7652|nr:GNAT family protein [Lysinibacillus sp. ZYM-1]KPN96882.1 alanine acetyltransferase [Lysinibacillus sp. ZYM-1]